jgi:malate dehydrogenase (quinone)
MQQYPLFDGMQYSEDPEVIKQWIPLVMEGRDPNEKVAATYTEEGTDVNFGALTRDLLAFMQKQPGVSLHLSHEVNDLEQDSDGRWILNIEDRKTKKRIKVKTKFVFIGAGGGALHLLEKSGIPEGRGFGGFPVSGQWLRCINPDVIARHHAKVYGKAAVGAPPMSVPHLDTRMIDGEQALLFGPYAGFSTRFLKNGSLLDLPTSIKRDNIMPMIRAGLDNLKLTKYLIDQVRQSPDDRLNALREYYPEAKKEDWRLEIAGQRVQVIKKDPVLGGVLEFGTEVVASADGTISALLGASPGASTSVSIMLELIERCFPDRIKTPEVEAKLRETIPSYKKSLLEDLELLEKVKHWTSEVLELNEASSIK